MENENELNTVENEDIAELSEDIAEVASDGSLLKTIGIGALIIGGGAAVAGAWHRWGKPAMAKMKANRKGKASKKRTKVSAAEEDVVEDSED